jgi:hypothetical protein
VTGVEYRLADWLTVADEYEAEAAVVHLDANWATPERWGAQGVDYVTHLVRPQDERDFSDAELAADHIDTSRHVADFIDAAWQALAPGGTLILDADGYASHRLRAYLADEFGEHRVNDAATAFGGGGFNKQGCVHYETKTGSSDRSDSQGIGSKSGYPVLFAHKPPMPDWSEAVRLNARRPCHTEPTGEYPQGSVKPVGPYRKWLSALADEGDLVLIPCAGSAPSAIAAEQEWGDAARVVCVDPCESSRDAYRRRREHFVDDEQPSLSAAVGEGETA